MFNYFQIYQFRSKQSVTVNSMDEPLVISQMQPQPFGEIFCIQNSSSKGSYLWQNLKYQRSILPSLNAQCWWIPNIAK